MYFVRTCYGAPASADLFRPVSAVLALVVALGLTIGVNYANDYSDGIRGTDDDRVGPMRLAAPEGRDTERGADRRVRVAGSGALAASPAGGERRVVAGRRRRAVPGGRVVLHRRLGAPRLPRPGRDRGVPVLRADRGPWAMALLAAFSVLLARSSCTHPFLP